MVHNLSETNSLVGQFVAELRNVNTQTDRMRFRRNMERLGEIMAYEISRTLDWETVDVPTPLGIAKCPKLKTQPVLGTVLRAGLALHQGLLNYFDQADCAFIGAFREHEADGSFHINMGYVTSPDINNRILIIADPMLATGASLALTLQQLMKVGRPSHIHMVCAIASQQGVDHLIKSVPGITLWVATIDPTLNDRAYIVPGLGDAGDLSYGEKMQA